MFAGQDSPAARAPCTGRSAQASAARAVSPRTRAPGPHSPTFRRGFQIRARAHLPWSLIQQMFIICITTVTVVCGRHCPRLWIRALGAVSETRPGRLLGQGTCCQTAPRTFRLLFYGSLSFALLVPILSLPWLSRGGTRSAASHRPSRREGQVGQNPSRKSSCLAEAELIAEDGVRPL